MGSGREPAAGEHTAGIQPLRPHQQRPAASSRRGRTRQQGDRRAAPDVRIRTVTPSPGAGFTATNRLDKVFEVDIVLKGLDGLLETAGGALLLPSRGVVRPWPADSTWPASRASPSERRPAPGRRVQAAYVRVRTRDGNDSHADDQLI